MSSSVQLEAQEAEPHELSAARKKTLVAKVWAWKEPVGLDHHAEMRRMGAASGWSHEYFTMDEESSRPS